MMRDQRIWGATAEEFRPERFLSDDINSRASELPDAASIPFGFGRRFVLSEVMQGQWWLSFGISGSVPGGIWQSALACYSRRL